MKQTCSRWGLNVCFSYRDVIKSCDGCLAVLSVFRWVIYSFVFIAVPQGSSEMCSGSKAQGQ